MMKIFSKNSWKYFGLRLVPLIVFASTSCSTNSHSPQRNTASSRLFDLPLETALGEHFLPGEDQADHELKELLVGHLKKHYGGDGVHAERAIHAKTQGCVSAEFRVLDFLEEDLRVGVFAKPRTFQAWIRFSNGDGPSETDAKRESRGMAVKLLDVDGDKILFDQRGAKTQDFLMADQAAFFLKDVLEYRDAIAAKEGSALKKAAFAATHPGELHYRSQAAVMVNPLHSRYWSKTPYKLGNQVIKFSAIPCRAIEEDLPPQPRSPDYLREAMKSQLDQKEACFDFAVQKRVIDGKEDETMPIEDASREWTAPFHLVAQITIPKQDFVSADRNQFCEDLSFTPWHSLPEHRPLGSLNRVRKLVYEEVSRWRRSKNGAPHEEPSH